VTGAAGGLGRALASALAEVGAEVVGIDRPGTEATVTADLTDDDGAYGNFKDGCAVLERPLRTVAPEFATREGRADYLARYREYLCPVTGLRVDSEIVKEGDEALHDIEIGAGR
jgi:NAD(P)-dependent dehydrogenase (short-subunit alcohol dehydrogenase family)